MRNTARQTRENRTITVNFQSEAAYFQLLGDRKAFLECVLAFVLSLGFQLKHKATCHGGGGLTRHSHYVRVRLGGPVAQEGLDLGSIRIKLTFARSAGPSQGHPARFLHP